MSSLLDSAIAPPSSDSVRRSLISSSLCISRCAFPSNPIILIIPWVNASKSHINGKNIFWNAIRGRLIQAVTRSGHFMAMSFGICSQKTICIKVIQKSAIPKAIAWIIVGERSISEISRKWAIHRAILGSPTQPSKRLATVMPSCIPERYVSRCERIDLVRIAHFFHCLISSSSWENRIFTSANSLATKNALSATRAKVVRSPVMIQKLGSGVILTYYRGFLYSATGVVGTDTDASVRNSGWRIFPQRYPT